MSCHSLVNDEYPTITRRISNSPSKLGLDLHVECLLHHNRAPTIKQMPVIGDITGAIYGIFESFGGMEQGQCAIRWLSRAGFRRGVFGPW